MGSQIMMMDLRRDHDGLRRIMHDFALMMHSGQLKVGDVERVAMNIRDWMQQVGG